MQTVQIPIASNQTTKQLPSDSTGSEGYQAIIGCYMATKSGNLTPFDFAVSETEVRVLSPSTGKVKTTLDLMQVRPILMLK